MAPNLLVAREPGSYTDRLAFFLGAKGGSVELRERLARIRERMAEAARRSGREPDAVALLAVTKGFGVEVARSAFALDLVDLGENRVQEAEGKIVAMGAGPRWHLIG